MRSLPLMATILVLLAPLTSRSETASSYLSLSPFGTIHLHRAPENGSRVIILASGAGGWTREAETLATRIASLGFLVIGVDMHEYLGRLAAAEDCTYPSADFESLSRFVQEKLKLPSYTQPILAGLSAGGALTYVTLLQAPSNVFAGGISFGLCHERPLIRAVCQGQGLEWSKEANGLLPAATPDTPWVLVRTYEDPGCSTGTGAFLRETPQTTVITSDAGKASSGAPTDDQLARSLEALSIKMRERALPEEFEMKGLPLVTIPAAPASAVPVGDRMALMISGDGGWAGLDQRVGEAIAAHDVPVLGINSLKYFWTPRTPEETAQDIAAAIRHYLKAWNKQRLVLMGYSFGADALPFVANRLPEDLQTRTELIVLLGPSLGAQFEFHLSNWFKGTSRGERPTLPEVKKLESKKLACFFGKDEAESLCPHLDASKASVVELSGGHHFDGDYEALAGRILGLLGQSPSRP